MTGEIQRRLEHGAIGSRNGGIAFVQGAGATPEPREVVWGRIGLGFENGFGGEGSDVVTARWRLPLGISAPGPIGQIEFGSASRFDARKGTFAGGPTAATLSPFAAPALNDAFAQGKGAFVAGEPLGTLSFSVGVR